MPFLPTALLRHWSRNVLVQSSARVALFVVDDIPQPTICFIHREMAPFLTTAAEQGRFKLYPVLEEAARVLAHRQGVPCNQVIIRSAWNEASSGVLFATSEGRNGEEGVTESQRAASHLWFANLNTPEEFAEAQLHLDALEI
jgi:molybdopterin-guanine dinucleotide biosynthesis protein A